ncbi:hypothetical protein [Acetobacter sp. DsW_059]|uniref:hypothetical protein n=1 Tax=Acetobacter sp. DsW_059 TaxID=1670661 RepID=UPI000A3AF8CD|nr:hypothetical protein [Acetobacter sp. DsW_059]OUJ05001.1 hypothetical protein HK25_06570 [Acetobacter sp. DsW_059]
MPNVTVKPVHFEDFGGSDFERLVFAYHLCIGWAALAWYGQTGSDQGRDIVGIEPSDQGQGRRTVIQCVNRESLTQAKAERDMANAVAAPTGAPDAFRFVCRSAVSAQRRDEIAQAARNLGVRDVTIWSGSEFEEHLRLHAEFLLRRFTEGVVFPDDGVGLRAFVDDFSELDDAGALSLIGRAFDRPAFRTPFMSESYLPAFLQAIEDTIGALNTGIWKTRDGVEIRRIPSLHHIRDARIRGELQQTVRALDALRRLFKRGLDEGRIRHCQCGQPDCPTFMVEPSAAVELDRERTQMLDRVNRIIPHFDVRID